MLSVTQSALQGINYNKQSFYKHAERISVSGQTTTDNKSDNAFLPEEMVGMIEAQRGVEANAALLRIADRTLGSLIDVLA